MKKIMFVMPLLTLSFLVSCGGSNPIGPYNVELTLDANGGKWSDGSTKKTISVVKGTNFATAVRPVVKPIKDNSTFAYYVSTSSSTERIEDFDINEKTTVFAYYTAYEYSVSFSSDKYTMTGNPTCKYGEEYTCSFTSVNSGNNNPTPKYKNFTTDDMVVKSSYNTLKPGTDYELSNNSLKIYGKSVKGEISINIFSAELSDDITWDNIIDIATTDESGGTKANTILSAGDYKKASNGINYRIIGFGHDTISNDEQTPAAITFEPMTCLSKTYKLSDDYRWYGDFSKATLCTELNDEATGVITTMPNEFKSAIKMVDKKISNQSIPTRFSAYLFPLSIVEIGVRDWEEYAGPTYEFYQNCFDEKLLKGTKSYWTRDGSNLGTEHGYYISYSASYGPDMDVASCFNYQYVAPAFCI